MIEFIRFGFGLLLGAVETFLVYIDFELVDFGSINFSHRYCSRKINVNFESTSS